jgi:hypothetical protein
MRKIPATNCIITPYHCPDCIKEFGGWKVAQHESLTVGGTALGLQVWCRIHNRNVVHIDFEGAKHKRSITPTKTERER